MSAVPAAVRRRPRASSARWASIALTAGAAVAALALVMSVHAAGQSLLAVTLLVVSVLALWTYTSPRSGALRYLFPGVAAAVVFVIFPMLYTVGISFTNHSSDNLLDQARARANLLGEAVPVPGSQRAFSLHAQGAQWVLHLQAPESGTGDALVSPPLTLSAAAPQAQVQALRVGPAPATPALQRRDLVPLLPALRALSLDAPDGSRFTLDGLRAFAQRLPLYTERPDGALVDRVTGNVYQADHRTGFFTSASGDRLQPGFRVAVGLRHYATIFSEGRFREPFVSVFIWTVLFAALSVLGAASLGLLLAGLLNWQALPFRGAYRMVLFLPYAVPGFISILVFKGLFNQNLGEINLILSTLFGVKPAWFSDPLLAKLMLLIVNIWLGFPYMMVLCSGLIQSIPADLYEASAVAGAGPWTNFTRITLPLIVKPLTPLLISTFAFNFNNFVLISLLTNGRPDQVDATLPAGTTDILVSYTWRIAFGDGGQQFGLAAAISTVIFLLVAAMTVLQMRSARLAANDPLNR